jgi:hypothetical protein
MNTAAWLPSLGERRLTKISAGDAGLGWTLPHRPDLMHGAIAATSLYNSALFGE